MGVLVLDIIQNRTGSIVNVKDDVSIYIGQNTDTHEVFVNLAAKTSSFVNSFSLPISDNYNGSLTTETNDVAITESSFRLMNILRVTDKNNTVSVICTIKSIREPSLAEILQLL